MNLNSEDPTIAAQLQADKDLDLGAVVKELLIELKQGVKGCTFLRLDSECKLPKLRQE